MNAHTSIEAVPVSGTWIATADNVAAELVGMIRDALTGNTIGYFELPGGHSFALPLGVPLCDLCDQPVHNGHCADCDVVLTPTIPYGMGRWA